MCGVDLWVGPEARHNAIGVCRRPRRIKRPATYLGGTPRPSARVPGGPAYRDNASSTGRMREVRRSEQDGAGRRVDGSRSAHPLPMERKWPDLRLTDVPNIVIPVLTSRVSGHAGSSGRRPVCRPVWSLARGLAEHPHMRDSRRRAELTRRVLRQAVQMALGASSAQRSRRRLPVAGGPCRCRAPIVASVSRATFSQNPRAEPRTVGPAAAHMRQTGSVNSAVQVLRAQVTPRPRRRQVHAGPRAEREPVRSVPTPRGPPAPRHRPSRLTLRG